jgi:soluble lytic murein transglycosylase-like protein
MGSRVFRIALIAGTCLAAANVASAELVFFSTGRTMSVKGHRQDGDAILLLLRGGGEIVCPSALIERIAPDEVPVADDASDLQALASVIQVPAQYAALIDRTAARHGVDPKLVRALIQVESAYRAEARSHKGAIGLMQLMPDTARRFAVKDPYDPGANIEGGIKYLKLLLDRFDVTPLALAAYNAGEAAVEKFQGIPPYAETRNYVRAVLKLAGLQ